MVVGGGGGVERHFSVRLWAKPKLKFWPTPNYILATNRMERLYRCEVVWWGVIGCPHLIVPNVVASRVVAKVTINLQRCTTLILEEGVRGEER